MAIQVSVTGFIQEVKEFGWGTVLEIAHPNRKKNDAGAWETVSTDYIDVIIDAKDKQAYSHILSAPKSTRVAVKGTMKWNAYLKRDGEAGAKMKIYPSEIETTDSVAAVKEVLKPLDISDAPF
jgi:single-stranded DNA-binding protein